MHGNHIIDCDDGRDHRSPLFNKDDVMITKIYISTRTVGEDWVTDEIITKEDYEVSIGRLVDLIEEYILESLSNDEYTVVENHADSVTIIYKPRESEEIKYEMFYS